MDLIKVSVELAPLAVAALRKVAVDEDVTLGQIIRDAVDRDLRRREKAKRAVRTDERLVAPLRSLLADELAWSQSWEELSQRLGLKGYALRESGGGLVLCCVKDGNRICKASELGYSHARLSRRLGRPFPGHAQGWIVARQM